MRGLSLKTTVLCLAASVLMACAQKPVTAPVSAAIEGAQRMERRAQIAYTKGDHVGALKDYQTAASVYASLALVDPAAIAQLNMAKIEGESGRVSEGLARVSAVLLAKLPEATALMAHGRAAALNLALQNAAKARQHIDTAADLCGNGCEAAAAIATLKAEIWLLAGDHVAARVAADTALQSAKTNADKANALRTRATIGLAQMGLVKGATAMPEVITDAEQALAIDQQLGASGRVVADLALLEKAHNLMGNLQQANRYKALRESAQTAREQLHLK